MSILHPIQIVKQIRFQDEDGRMFMPLISVLRIPNTVVYNCQWRQHYWTVNVEGTAMYKGRIQDWMHFKMMTLYLAARSDSPSLALCRDCGTQESCTGSPACCPAIIWLSLCCEAWGYTVKWLSSVVIEETRRGHARWHGKPMDYSKFTCSCTAYL